MMQWPLPSDDAAPIADPTTVVLGPAEQATISFSPDQSGTTFYLPVVAASKEPDTEYRIKIDDTTVWGPSEIPPTDIDDLQPVWMPAQVFQSRLVVEITNLRTDGGERRYHVLPVGFEE